LFVFDGIYASLESAMCMHALFFRERKEAGNPNRFLLLSISRGIYFPGAENVSEFRASRSVRMHIWHMPISIIMFSEMAA